MAYNVADCANNKVCTKCPSRIGCDMRKIFYDAAQYQTHRNYAFVRGVGSARSRGFSEAECNALAENSVAVMDHRREEELKLHPQYSET